MKRNRWYFFIMLIVTGLIVGKTIDVNADPIEDSQLILSLSNQIIDGNKKIVFKYFSPYQKFNDQEDLLKTATELSKIFNLPAISVQVHEEEQSVYKTTVDLQDGVRFSLLYMGMYEDHSSNLIIKMETENEKGLIRIAQLQREAEKKLRSLGLSANWNIMMQGILAPGYSDQKQLNRWLEQNLDVKVIEHYEDTGTVSVSYFSPKIHSILQTGEKKMNLQLAVHKNSVTDQWRITLGTPVITIEY